MTVLVTGATGFIGRRLVLLLSQRYAVRCLVRDVARAKIMLPAAVELVPGDMTNPVSLLAAFEGAQAVVHLAALKNDDPGIGAVNVGGARSLIAACKAAGVRRVINIGSQAARLARLGDYGDTKAQADALFGAADLDVTTLLPSLVYGPQDTGAFGKLARAAATWPFVPVIGDGRVRFQPVHVDDVCAVIDGCLRAPATIGKVYSVGGGEAVTLTELIDLIGEKRGRKPLKVHLPGGAALLIARVLALVFASPPLSRSNVLGAIQSAPDTDYAAIFSELGLSPRSLAAGLNESL